MRRSRLAVVFCLVVASFGVNAGVASRVGPTRMAPPGGIGLVAADVAALDALVGRGAQPATEVPYSGAPTEVLTFPSFSGRGKPETTDWRVIRGTGNGAENYLATMRDGTILDFGGEWLRISRDDGRTWSQVVPEGPLGSLYEVGAEGAVAVAPGGDIVGVGWFLGAGDLIIPFKYEADSGKWTYSVNRLGMPAFDRPSVGVLPGPFTVAGEEVPYISVLRGGILGFKSTFYSFDGLNYVKPGHRVLESLAREVGGPLDVEEWSDLDWLQPHEQTGLTPIGHGAAIGGRSNIALKDQIVPRSIFDPETLTWSRYRFPDSGPPESEPQELVTESDGRLLADSDGDLHHVQITGEGSRITYMRSSDGGASWSKRDFPLLDGHRVNPYFKSFRVSGALDTAVMVVHAVVQDDPLITRDLVYRFDISGEAPRVEKVYVLGSGDFGSWAGGTEGVAADAQMDFSTIGLLPDGRIVVSFTDYTHRRPTVAVELKKPVRLPAGKPGTVSRVVTQPYTTAGARGVTSVGRHTFVAGPTERAVEVVVEDATGRPVPYSVWQEDPDGSSAAFFRCGGEKEPIPISQGWSVTVWVEATSDQCLLSQPGPATTGTITVTFRH